MICPDLKIGLIFECKNNIGKVFLKTEILDFSEDGVIVKVKILSCDNEYFSRYLDSNKEYTARLVFDYPDMKTWEIPPEQMKRDVSQILLEWQKDSGNFSWDLDS
jgi:hypothetical protein